MERKKKNFLVSGLIVLAVVAIVLGFTLSDNVSKEEKITIGTIAPLSGPGSYLGSQATKGVSLAEEEINKNGGINGKELEIIVKDSKADGSEAVTAFKNMEATKNPEALITAFSAPTLALAPTANKKDIPLITTVTSDPEIPSKGKNIFRVFTTSKIDAPVMADYALNDLNASKFGILYINDEYGQSYRDAFKEEVEKNGGSITATESFKREDSDFKTQLTKIKESGAEAIYIVGFDGHYISSFVQSVELGLDQKLLGNWILASPNVISKMEKRKEGLSEKGYMTTPDYYVNIDKGKSAQFNKRFEEKYNSTADAYSAFGYDTTMLLAEAIREEGSKPSDIRKGLRDIEHEGVIGNLSFNDEGEINFDLHPAKVEDSQLVLLE